jgi:hypothetical protein
MREPFATIFDRVNDRDRAFFSNHPGERAYLRSAIPGEHDPKALKEMGIDPPGLDDWVLVHRVAPGICRRQPVGRIISDRPVQGRITLVFPEGGIVEDVPVVDGAGAV